MEIHAYTLADPAGMGAWGDVVFRPIRPHVSRPAIAKFNWFYAATLPQLRIAPLLRRRAAPLVHATGACSLVSDVVQVQFVHAAWKFRQRALPEDAFAAPFARGKRGVGAWGRTLYQNWLQDYNIALEHLVYARGKTYLAIAGCVAREMELHFGIPRERLHVIHHGVDSAAFRPAGSAEDRAERAATRAHVGIRPDEVAVAFVGAYERKGLARAIDAVAALSPEARRRVRLVAVGSGAVEGFRRRAADAGVEERVLFVEHTRDVGRYYRACDLFVLPTLYEPFGLVALEAMASGLPPVISELAGAAELIRDGESGLLIREPTDAREIAGKLESLILDDALRLKMAGKARQAAALRTWDRVAEEYAAVLEPLLK